MKKLRIVAMSDIHGQHRYIPDIQPGDVLIVAGDVVSRGGIVETSDFLNWLNKQPHKHKIFVPGNHDGMFETNLNLCKGMASNVHILVDEEICIEGFKFYGSPYQPWFNDWHFNLPANSEELKAKWDMMPKDIDVLITHCPPYKILDSYPKMSYNAYHELVKNEPQHCGCKLLRKAVLKCKPLLHLFGHIHESHGAKYYKDISFYNCSLLNGRYEMVNRPHTIELEKERKIK